MTTDKVIKYLGIILTLVLTSFFIFPFSFIKFPAANTKMIMAGAGLVILLFRLSQGKTASISKDIFVLSMIAVVVSFIGLISTVINGAYDYTYATYIVSMWVWLGGAYTLTVTMKTVHGYIGIRLICYYIIAVSALQCIIAFGMDYYPWLKNFVDSFLAGEGFMGKQDGRLYGIGCALDVAGMKFSAVLIMVSFFIISGLKGRILIKSSEIMLLVSAMLIIAVIGNMIGRTAIIGVGLGLLLIITYQMSYKSFDVSMFNKSYMIWKICGIFLLVIAISIYLYYNNNVFHKEIRFGFEGFFNLFENGKWETNSNSMLKSMITWPNNLWTWIIGDGYFNNPLDSNSYYIGDAKTEFYMGTDIGYLRFIFYFGLIGLAAFICYFCKVTQICITNFPSYKLMFLFILMANFIIWFKVSSDFFVIFSPFLCITTAENEEYENSIREIYKDEMQSIH